MTRQTTGLAAAGQPMQASANRSADRSDEAQAGAVVFEIARLVTAAADNLCIIRGISPRGAIIQTSRTLERGEKVSLEVRSGELIDGTVSATFPVGSSIWFDKPAEVKSLPGGARPAGSRGRPRLPRLARNAPVTVEAGDLRLDGAIRNISMAGACVELARPEDVPALSRITVTIEGLGAVPAVVKWLKGGQIGIKFERPAGFDELAAWLSATPAPAAPPSAANDENDHAVPTRRRRRAAARTGGSAPTAGSRPLERRGHKRITTVFRLAKMVGDREELCLIRNVSASGLKAEVFSSKSVGERLAIDFGDRLPQAARVAWVDNGYVGIAFDDQIDVVHTLENVPPPGDRRARRLRFLVEREGELLVERRRFPCLLVDMSQGGAKIRSDAALEVGARVRVMVDDHPELTGTVLWVRGRDAGIAFLPSLAYRELAGWIVKQDASGDDLPGDRIRDELPPAQAPDCLS